MVQIAQDSNEATAETEEFTYEVKPQPAFGGYIKQVSTLKEIIDLKLISKRLESIKGVLVHGPAGAGKTMLITSILNDQKYKVVKVTPSDLLAGD